MADARKLSLADLREIIVDKGELQKGTQISDAGQVAHLSRFEGKLFCDASGSGASPYKVQIVFGDDGTVKGRCSCMAARSRPFCKHACALLVAWARAPESFAVSDVAPAGAGAGEAKRKEVKKGKTDTKDLMGKGVEQASTLVRELSVSGVAAVAADRVDQVRALGEALREARLRRMSARTLELAAHLQKAASRTDAFDPNDYAELLSDMLLTVRKLEKHLAGEPIADEHVEELIGKTWTKKDRKPVAGLDLVEYAFSARVTPDDFVIRESRLVDLATGEHYSEKQILPSFLAKRTDAKKSWAGKVLAATNGSIYPSYAPKRLDLETVGNDVELDQAALARLLQCALPDVSGALAALQERRKDVFAPEALPVAIRTDAILAEGARMQIVDAASAALFLPDEDALEAELATALRNAKLEALLGDVVLDGALPTLVPLAAVVRVGEKLSLETLGGVDTAQLLASRKVKTVAKVESSGASRWAEAARRAGASTAAIALGEVREEMAHALATGLPSVGRRFADPLASRLKDLGLTKQADLLTSIADRTEAEAKLDDFVKLYQVLGIALARLAGATHVDRASLEPVPTFESVFVKAPERSLSPDEVAREHGAGRINRYEAAAHYARHYEALDPDALAASIYPTWADGSASPYIARAFAKHPSQALAAARRALGFDDDDPRFPYWRAPTARVAKLTAIRVLAAVANAEAKAMLFECVRRREVDVALAAHAQRALRAMTGEELPPALRKEMKELVATALNASQKDDRIRALRALGERGFVEAIPAMRASFAGDVSGDVREAAAYALSRVGDVDSVDTFVALLRDRYNDKERGKIGAYALGGLGDVRGVEELLAAYAEGWQPAILAESLRQLGPAGLEPLLDLLERRPEVADRKAALDVIGSLPPSDVQKALVARLDAIKDAPDFCERAGLWAKVAGASRAAKDVATYITTLRPSILDKKKSTSEEKALLRKCSKWLAQ